MPRGSDSGDRKAVQRMRFSSPVIIGTSPGRPGATTRILTDVVNKALTEQRVRPDT
jgi:hypothetical protein